MQNVLRGDCVQMMQSMEENSVDAIVTDPPY
jgi:DNA modification methylase